jgi:methylenetetrahydrofolate dehydrogenase (NADP+) / methenyltetrahydrofolate cyclohydrolase
MTILDGIMLSNTIKAEIKTVVDDIKASGKRPPHLVAFLVGENGASKTYIGSKIKSCAECGFDSTLYHEGADITEAALLEKIKMVNANPDIDGYIVQLPLPKHINEENIINAISPEKDVDGFTPINFGRMALGMPCYIPATPYGILQILERYNIETEGKSCVVIGRSNIVGKPMSILMSSIRPHTNCTVTLVHSKTKNIEQYTREADIVICALGKPLFLKSSMIKDGAVLIDVGITRVDDASTLKGYVIQGDIDFEDVKGKCSAITPVPGGVGPMTVTMLLKNTLQAYQKKSI